MADRVGQILGNYQLLRLLGRGAFAEVYLAEHRYLEVPTAIKVLHVRMEPDTQEQFLREARTIAHLQHPHIVRVLDFGFQDQTPFLVMEYTPNGTLRTQHPKGTRLPLEQVVAYVKQIASALDYAHQQRVIHRDVKPDNLLLNANHEVVLSDFGLSVVQRTLDSLSMSNPVAGTPLYMAPEQIQRQPCAASDQYALGILAYEWLAGEAPFRGKLFEVFSHHLYQPPPSLCEPVPDLPFAVEEAVFKALAKDPEQRFACVADFASALGEACSAIQPLTLPGLPKPRTQEPTVSQSTPFVPPSTAREQEGSSFSTQPMLMTAQQRERGQERMPLTAPGPLLHNQPISKQVKPPLAQNNRQRFLKRVRAFWIEGVLEHSLHGDALITLGLQEQLDALANPWHLVLQHLDAAPRSFPLGTRITEVYDAANGELLILGAPGSGKTTLLLELARDLLDRAEQDEQHLMPVIFPLSSWTEKQPLTEWLVEELISKYQVPPKLARAWVDTDQILPLLDGLDEVPAENRTACIETVNTYHQEHAFLPLVVSSRSADYLAQTARVKLTSAVTIQSLTPQQVDDYLARGGEALWALRVALDQDAALRELTETPLMLSILTLTYHDLPVEDLLRGGIAPTHQQVFEHYTERMLRYRRAERRYPQEQTTHWLAWLAQQMKQHNQTVFYIEHLQPSWLSGEWMRQAYDRWAVRFPAILMGMLASLAISTLLYSLFSFSLSSVTAFLALNLVLGGFIGWLLGTGRTTQQSHQSSEKARRLSWPPLVRWLVAGILIGLSAGLMVGLTDASTGLIIGPSVGLGSILLLVVLEKGNTTASSLQAPLRSQKPKWQHLMKSADVKNGILVGLLLGLSVGLALGLSAGLVLGLSAGLIVGLIFGLTSGLSAGLSCGLLSVLLIGKPVGISLADELVWSWRSLGRSLLAKKHLKTTLRLMVLVGLSFGLIVGLSDGLTFGLIVGLSFGLSVWLLLGLFQGVSSETIEDRHRVVPNQGIRRSARNSLVLGLISTAIVWLVCGLSIGLSEGLSYRYRLSAVLSFGLIVGLIIGLSAGLLAGLLNGGLACLRHSMVRLLLWRAGSSPWNYPRFLDYAAERILLRKVGGGYIFVHRLLLEYFASLDSTPTPDAASAKKKQA